MLSSIPLIGNERKIKIANRIALLIFVYLISISPLVARAECFFARNNNSQDTWIATGGESNTSHGDSYEIWVANHSDYISYGLLKFDLSQIPKGSVVKEVVIYFHADYIQGSDYLDLYEITSAWEENVTYSTRPTWNGSRRIATVYYVEGNSRYSFASDDLTALVQNWVNASQTNYGLLLSARTVNNNSVIQLRSSENGLNYYPPEICITYVPEKKLAVPYYSQYDSHWCPAACAAMLLRYYGKNKKLWDVAANDSLNWAKNVGLNTWWETFTSSFGDVFTDAGLTYERKGDIFSPWLSGEQLISYVKSQLIMDRPVMVGSTAWHHTIVITGFDTENGGHIYVHDPDGCYVNGILHLNVGNLLNVKIDYVAFLNTVSNPATVLTYAITSPVPSDKQGVSISPTNTGSIGFSNTMTLARYLKFELDASQYPYGYYWVDVDNSFEDDEIVGNKVTTTEDLNNFQISIGNSNYETRSLTLRMEITNLDNHDKRTIFDNYSIEVGASSIEHIDRCEWITKGIISAIDIDLSRFVSGNYEMTFYLLNASGTEVLDSFSLKFVLVKSSDVDAPRAPLSLQVIPNSWSRINSFNLSWNNPTDESGIQAVWYKIGTPPASSFDGTRIEGTQIHSLDGISVPTQGINNLYVWLEDGAGNRSESNYSQVTLYYDHTPPTNGTITINDGEAETQSLIVNLGSLAALDNLSGVSKMSFSNSSNGPWSPWESYASSKIGWDLSKFGGNTGYGIKTVYVKYKDSAGNESGRFSDTIDYVPSDTTPPSSPINLSASPDNWSNVNSFIIDWTNPSDPSGITAAWYKVGSMPNANNDGTRTTHHPFTAHADHEGARNIYVWLEDSIGNLSHNNYSQVTLYYDHTPPTNGTITINDGEAETQSLIVNLGSLAALDNLSGVSKMSFSNSSNGPWSPWESYSVVKTGWDLSAYGGDTSPGTKTVYVKYKDAAGNWSEIFSDCIEYVVPAVAYVAPEGDCGGNSPCYSSIQEAIDSTSDSCIIKVAEGEYHENIEINQSKNITIEGGWNSSFSVRNMDPSVVLIDGEGNGSVIKIAAEEGESIEVTIDGVTIQNGNAPNGGGIYAEGVSLKLLNSIVCSNRAYECIGGGLDLRNCYIELVNDEISNNQNDQGGGAGISVSGNCTGFIRSCRIHDNVIEQSGCTQWDGGGILIHTSSITVDGNKIYNNRAGFGGGIAIDFNQASLISNNIIWNNIANYGGGIFIAHSGSAPQIINDTIVGNRANYSGGGVEVWDNTKPVFINCIVWGNGENNFNSASVTFSNIEDEYSGEGNISEDPGFVDPDGPDNIFGSADDDFHLTSDSPCVDTGSNDNLSASDFEKDSRLIDGNMDGTNVCDMGADEFKPFEYWFPWSSNEAWWPNDQQSSMIDVIAAEKDTKVFVDSNFDGVINNGEACLNISSPSPNPAHLVTDLDPPAGFGVRVISNKPISCWYERRNNNWSTYDDEMLMYSPSPVGKFFVVPFEGTVTCVATHENTKVTTPYTEKMLAVGEIISFESKPGDLIEADQPIAVCLHTVDRSNMDNTLATGIYPANTFGKEFYVVNKFKTNYPGQVDHRRLFIVYFDGSYEQRDVPGTPSDHPITSKIVLQKDGFIYYKFDVEDESGRHFTFAYPVPPTNSLGTDYAYGGSIISADNKNNIYIDSNYDGIYDKIISLNAGGTYNLPYRVSDNGYNNLMTRANIGRIHSDHPVFVFYFNIVSDPRDEACMGRIIPSIPVVPSKLGRSADIDNDGDVDGADLASIAEELASGSCNIWHPCPCDLNNDSRVDSKDLQVFGAQYGLSSSSELNVLASNVLNFSCFGDNCGHPDSCCVNDGGEHCSAYNEGLLTLPRIINLGNIARVEISMVNVNTQGSSDRFLDYFLSLNPDAQSSGLTLLSNHRVPGFSELKKDPLVIDITDEIMSLGLSTDYYFGVLNDDYWEVSVGNIQLKVNYVTP